MTKQRFGGSPSYMPSRTMEHPARAAWMDAEARLDRYPINLATGGAQAAPLRESLEQLKHVPVIKLSIGKVWNAKTLRPFPRTEWLVLLSALIKRSEMRDIDKRCCAIIFTYARRWRQLNRTGRGRKMIIPWYVMRSLRREAADQLADAT